MYSGGLGVKQDHAEAMRLYTLSAAHNLPQAQIAMGQVYEYGRGVSEDFDIAEMWYTRASEQGFTSAEKHLKDLAEHRDACEAFASDEEANASGQDQATVGRILMAHTTTLHQGIASKYAAPSSKEAVAATAEATVTPLDATHNSQAENKKKKTNKKKKKKGGGGKQKR
jgi:TPR repeat protein